MSEFDEDHVKESFLEVLQYLNPLSENTRGALKGITYIRHFKNQEYLIREGEIVRNVNFLAEGVVRVFYSDEKTEYNKNIFHRK